MRNSNTKLELINQFDLDDIPWDHGKKLFTYWNKIRGERSMPRRKDFNPMDVPQMLPNILLIEFPDGDIEKAKFRLVGTNLVRDFGQDITGQSINDLENNEIMMSRVRWLIENKKPYLVINSPLLWATNSYKQYCLLGLPLSNDGKKINIMITLMHFL
jgi:hypothetical protein